MSAAAEVRLKFERSRHHLAELDEAIAAYWQGEPFAVERAEDEATGDLVTVCESGTLRQPR